MKQNRWYRIAAVVTLALGVFIQIYWNQKRRATETERNEAWKNIARKLLRKMYELEGLLIKVGQLLSVRGDLLPQAFIEEMKELVDQVPSSSWKEIEQVLEREWGTSYQERLKSIDQQAVASASIGEVYKGELKDGTAVAVKVQRPKIRHIIKADFQALAIVMWIARTFIPSARKFVNFTQLYKEIRQVIERELDFLHEMQTAHSFQERFAACDYVMIPKMFPEHCTSKLLVMEWVETMHITQPQLKLDRKDLAQKLLTLFLPQWLGPGYFHADPHVGNVLLHREGKIILLDFGMVGEITSKDAEALQELIEGLVLKNYAQVVRCCSRLGFMLPGADLKEMEQTLAEMLSMDFSSWKELDVLSMKKEINSMVRSLPIQVPTRFVFLGRSVAIIQGLIQTLCPDEDLYELAKPVFMEWLDQQGGSKWKLFVKWFNALPIVKAAQQIPELLQEPGRLRESQLEQQRRQFRFKRFESAKTFAFVFGLFNGGFAYISLFIKHAVLFQVSASFTGLAFVWYAWTAWQQRKWMKRLK